MWGTFGTGDGQFFGHEGIAVDSNGDNHVTDVGHNRVQKFTRTGNFIRKWGSQCSDNDQFMIPHGIATFAVDTLLVADSANDRIQEFLNDGAFITKWGSQGTRESEFNSPIDVGINRGNNMHYISDHQNYRIQMFHWDPGVVINPFPDLALPD